MGLRYNEYEAVERKINYADLDSTLRRRSESGSVLVPILQEPTTLEKEQEYVEYSGFGQSAATSTARVYGQNTKIRDVVWSQFDGGTTFNYVIYFNGYRIQSGGVLAGTYTDQQITDIADFKDKIMGPEDYFEIVITKTGGTNPGAGIKIKGWNI